MYKYFKIQFHIALLLITVLVSCSNDQANNTAVADKVSTTAKDTVIFIKGASIDQQPEASLQVFDDSGQVEIAPAAIKLEMKDSQEEFYKLQVFKSGKRIFVKDSLKGISKVWHNSDQVLFTYYTYFDEDGNNEGHPVFIDVANGSVLVYPALVRRTANPVSLNGYYYVNQELSCLVLDKKLNMVNAIPIVYHDKQQSKDYLDRYLICSYAVSDSTGKLIVQFTPNKVGDCVEFWGVPDMKAKAFLLNGE